jgi:mRNA-degrading endonuclease RelE of RelBE toxin-antitoxin system
MKSEIVFGDKKLRKELDKIDKDLRKQLDRAFANLKENVFCGIQIPKRLIPKEYIKKFGNITNLWKYNLPDAWRLIYTIKNNNISILSVVLEWMDHKTYERRFKY